MCGQLLGERIINRQTEPGGISRQEGENMVIAIMKWNNGDFMICSNNPLFVERWGAGFLSGASALFENMQNVANWAKKTLDEECLFEVV